MYELRLACPHTKLQARRQRSRGQEGSWAMEHYIVSWCRSVGSNIPEDLGSSMPKLNEHGTYRRWRMIHREAKAAWLYLLLVLKRTRGQCLISCCPGWPPTPVLVHLPPKCSASGMCHMPANNIFVLVFFGRFLCVTELNTLLVVVDSIQNRTGFSYSSGLYGMSVTAQCCHFYFMCYF